MSYPVHETIIDVLTETLKGITRQGGYNHDIKSVIRYDNKRENQEEAWSEKTTLQLPLCELKWVGHTYERVENESTSERMTGTTVEIDTLLGDEVGPQMPSDKRLSLLSHDIDLALARIDPQVYEWNVGRINSVPMDLEDEKTDVLGVRTTVDFNYRVDRTELGTVTGL